MEQPLDPGLFRDPQRARQDLERIGTRVPSGIASALPLLLAESPNPDQALNLLERLVREDNQQLIGTLNQHRALLHYVIAIFGNSYWLGETLVHNPEIVYALQRDNRLERSLGREDFRENFGRFRSRSLETDISVLLARFKKREYVRIALRDVLGIAALAETTAEISALSDVLIEEALREAEAQMRRRYGASQYHDAHGRLMDATFSVLSLGKLGGNELNYSSDVDLLYIYSGQETPGADALALSMREYFVRQAQLLTEILSRVTSEGPVFRIDLRLRPQGAEGEPVVGSGHALHYYAHVAHDWELQALIKVRHSAGDMTLARTFIRGVQPHVYTENVNFEAVETAVNARSKISAHRRRAVAAGQEPDTVDVKLDRGGIRDIEFLVQCLQRVYGGAETWLRSGGTLFSLQKLHDKGHISGQDFHELSLAYEFLRKVEHRLQLQRGQQIHRLPSSADGLQVLRRTIGRNAGRGDEDAFVAELQLRMASVAQIYERVIYSQQQKEKSGIESFSLTPPPAVAARELSFGQVLQRIAQDSPALEKLVAQSGAGVHARRSLHRFLSSAMTSPERYAALLENPAAVERAMELFATSEYLTDVLVRHPDAIRALDSPPRAGEQAVLETVPAELFDPFSSVNTVRDEGEALAVLRQIYRNCAFASAAHDILDIRPASASMQENTRIADAAIACALQTVRGEQTLGVFALGRLGTQEFDIASDADLLFVRAAHTAENVARAQAERLMQSLAAYTKEGSVFAVDARLRPHGGEGELVVTPAQLGKYLIEEAQPWEALTYTKLRFVAGPADITAEVVPLTHQRIAGMAADPAFTAAVADMRKRLEKSNRYANSFKLTAGGFYDIDFLASYLMLKQGAFVPGNTQTRLQHLLQSGALPESAFHVLDRACLLYRTVDHVIRLVTGRARPELPATEHARQATERLVSRILQRSQPQELQTELNETARQVRDVFRELLE